MAIPKNIKSKMMPDMPNLQSDLNGLEQKEQNSEIPNANSRSDSVSGMGGSGLSAVKRTGGIVAVVSALFIVGIIGLVFWVLLGPEWDQDKIRETGLPAEAVIVSLEDTGNTFNEKPQVEVFLDVTRPGETEPYRTSVKMIISPVYMTQFEPGTKVKVKYDADNPQEVAILE